MFTSESQRWYSLAIFIILGWLLYLLSPILTPFVVSALLAYLADPLVDKLEARKIRRVLAVSLVFLLILLVLLILGIVIMPQLEAQISTLLKQIPGYIEWTKTTLIPWINDRFGGYINFSDVGQIQSLLSENWKEAGGTILGMLGTVSESGITLLGWAANLVLIPVLTFYLLRDWDDLVAGIHALLPRSIEPTVSGLAREADEMLGAFLRGQILVMAGLSIIYTSGLMLVGLDFALLIGLFAGLVSFVPYLGLIIGILFAGIAAIMQFKGIDMLPWVILVFIVGQLVEGMFLTPKLVGDRIGMHPVAVIFAIMAGGQLYGFFGILLALPVASVVIVLVRHALLRYRASGLYHGNQPVSEFISDKD
ncbi:MAG: AI-2E family transporter [Gammaproteobacteria bacterium]